MFCPIGFCLAFFFLSEIYNKESSRVESPNQTELGAHLRKHFFFIKKHLFHLTFCYQRLKKLLVRFPKFCNTRIKKPVRPSF